MINRRRFLGYTAASLSELTALGHVANAQQYPDRPVHIIVPFAAGAPDSVARIIAQQLQTQTKQSFVVENRPAANGTVGTDAVAKAPPDGYTLLVPSASSAVNPSIYRTLPYNVLTDLEPITPICRGEGYVLVVNPSVPAKTVQELLSLARDPKSKLSYGSPGVGNTLHLAAELFKARTGMDMTHVPYRGAGPAISDLIGGRIQVMFVTPPLSPRHIRAGKLRPLAYTAAKRWSCCPSADDGGSRRAGFRDGWRLVACLPGKNPGEYRHAACSRGEDGPHGAGRATQYFRTGFEPFCNHAIRVQGVLCRTVRFYAELVRLAKIDRQ